MKKKNLTGRKFGRLTVIKESLIRKGNRITWVCKCVCGNTKIVRGGDLLSDRVNSCGCLRKEITAANNKKNKTIHGYHETPTYRSLASIKSRCLNIKDEHYKDYGGRGITVCDRWRYSFEKFLKDMGEKLKNKTIDRTDNNKGYFPSNCKWATQKEQSRNTRANRLIEYKGEIKCLTAWAAILNISVQGLFDRLAKYTTEKAFTMEYQVHNRH